MRNSFVFQTKKEYPLLRFLFFVHHQMQATLHTSTLKSDIFFLLSISETSKDCFKILLPVIETTKNKTMQFFVTALLQPRFQFEIEKNKTNLTSSFQPTTCELKWIFYKYKYDIFFSGKSVMVPL